MELVSLPPHKFARSCVFFLPIVENEGYDVEGGGLSGGRTLAPGFMKNQFFFNLGGETQTHRQYSELGRHFSFLQEMKLGGSK